MASAARAHRCKKSKEKECCVKILCGSIPFTTGLGVAFNAFCHCWIIRKDCDSDDWERFDVWETELYPPNDPRRLGKHLYRNMSPPTHWNPPRTLTIPLVGVITAPPAHLSECFSQCYPCEPQAGGKYKYTPCECLKIAIPNYRWKDDYVALGSNSNSFVGFIQTQCLIGIPPPQCAVGWLFNLKGTFMAMMVPKGNAVCRQLW